jgi:competence protein ComEA
MKPSLKNYFQISKKEWNGMVVLMVLIVLVLLAPTVFSYFHKDKPLDLLQFNLAVKQLEQAQHQPVGQHSFNHPFDSVLDSHLSKPAMFVFNPNKLPAQQWKALGLSQRQINSIEIYQLKGGRFVTKADVKKMYALNAADYLRLQPFINLPDGTANAEKTDQVIELNTADSAKLTQVRGIGPAFAARIVDYKKQLGGFYKKEQLREVYGIDSMKYADLEKRVSVDPRRIVRLNINNASIDDLRHYPYFNFKQMNAIIEYRKQHGNYHNLSDLRNVAILDESVINNIKPYFLFK